MVFSCMLNSKKRKKMCTQPKLPLTWANIFKAPEVHGPCCGGVVGWCFVVLVLATVSFPLAPTFFLNTFFLFQKHLSHIVATL